MKLLTAQNSTDEIQMQGEHLLAFKANTGALQIQIKVDDGVFIPLEDSKTADFSNYADFKDAVLKFEITGDAKLVIYGGFYA